MFNNLPDLFSQMDKISERINLVEKECIRIPFSVSVPCDTSEGTKILKWNASAKRLIIIDSKDHLSQCPLIESKFLIRTECLPALENLVNEIRIQIEVMVETLKTQGVSP
jgi:hypothetical protein